MNGNSLFRAVALGAGLLWAAAPAFGEGGANTSAQAAYVIWPDGVAVTDSIPPTTGISNEGTPQWFRFGSGARRSYSVEIFQLRENGYNSPAQATLTAAFSDTAGTVPVAFTDLSFADPGGGDYNPPAIRRYVVRDVPVAGRVMLRIASGLNFQTSATQTFQLRVIDTTLIGTRVSTLGYDTFVALHNSADYQVSASIHFYDESGAFVGTQVRAINGRGSVQVRYAQDDPTYGGRRGAVEVTHDGSPGSVVGHTYWYNPTTTQFGPQMELKASRSWGRGSF